MSLGKGPGLLCVRAQLSILIPGMCQDIIPQASSWGPALSRRLRWDLACHGQGGAAGPRFAGALVNEALISLHKSKCVC